MGAGAGVSGGDGSFGMGEVSDEEVRQSFLGFRVDKVRRSLFFGGGMVF